MIYTLTMSPSIDFVNEIEHFEINKINRSIQSIYLPGGKGINVSLVLKELNIDSIALGYKANFSGEYLQRLLDNIGIKSNLIEADGFTRINVKIMSDTETAINTNTLVIKKNHIELLKEKISKLSKHDILIISGNVPKDLSENIYEELIKNLDKDIKIIVDAEGELLVNTLKYEPFLIKPNRQELETIFKVKINQYDDAYKYAKKLKDMGAKNVIVSLDKDGAILLDENNKKYYLKNIEGKLVNSVGAGDSLIAGFICGIERKYNSKDSFMLGVACANATAFSKTIANKFSIEKTLTLLKEINN